MSRRSGRRKRRQKQKATVKCIADQQPAIAPALASSAPAPIEAPPLVEPQSHSAVAVKETSIAPRLVFDWSTWEKLFAAAEVVLAAAIARFAYVQADASDRQWSAMIDQNVIMSRQIDQADKTLELMRLEQRPWIIAAGNPKLLKPITAHEKLDISLSLTNAGKSPAIVKYEGHGLFTKPRGEDVAEELEIVWRHARSKVNEFPMGPDASHRVVNYGEATITENTKRAIESGELNLYFFSVGAYTDVTGADYGFENCFIYDQQLGLFVMHRKHNRAEVPPSQRGD